MTTMFIDYLYETFVGSETSDITPATAFQRFVRTLCCASKERRGSSWVCSSSDGLLWNGKQEKGGRIVPLAFMRRIFEHLRSKVILAIVPVQKRRQQCLASVFL